jgi:serine phosphatase RsbU (regulator of sigma subunit)
MKFSYRSKLTLLIFVLVFSALGAVTTFFLDLYRGEKLSTIYESELATTSQLASSVENMIHIAASAELDDVRKSRDLIFVADDPCGPQPTIVISGVYQKALNDLNLKPQSWVQAEEIRRQCMRIQTSGITAPQVFEPGKVGGRLYMPTLLALVPPSRTGQAHGGKSRLILLSLDGTGTGTTDHAYFITTAAGTAVWSDTTAETLDALKATVGIAPEAFGAIAADMQQSGLASIGRKGADGILAYAPFLSQLTFFSLNSERALLRSADFMLGQSLLLVGGFLLTCFFFGRLFAVRLTRPLNELTLAAEAVGQGDFSRQLVVTETDEISVIKRSFNVMTARIVQLLADTKNKAMLDSEIAVAQQVQKMLLPGSLIRTSNHEISSFVQMANKCGGDWWGYTEIPIPGRQPVLLLMIGDVTGHGVPSALLTAAAQGGLSAISTFLEAEFKVSATLIPVLLTDPRLVLHLFNRAVFQSGGGTLAMSFFTCLLDPETEVLHTANAGHNKPYLIDERGKLTPLGPSGNVLGKTLVEEFPEIETHPWKKGSQVFLYTDGLIDCYQGDRNLFERKHLVRLLKETKGLKGPGLLQKILQERAKMIKGLREEDDVTAVVVTHAPLLASKRKPTPVLESRTSGAPAPEAAPSPVTEPVTEIIAPILELPPTDAGPTEGGPGGG